VSGPRLALDVIDRSGGRPRIGRARLQRVLDAALAEAGIARASLTVLLVGDGESGRLHEAHFSDPTPTDVMTFPDGEVDPESGLLHLGDLAVGVAVARREAVARGRPLADELTLYVLHGLLHLLGYDDVSAAKLRRMWAAQRRLLQGVGIGIEEHP
jgi:probable rRNA maturation factor